MNAAGTNSNATIVHEKESSSEMIMTTTKATIDWTTVINDDTSSDTDDKKCTTVDDENNDNSCDSSTWKSNETDENTGDNDDDDDDVFLLPSSSSPQWWLFHVFILVTAVSIGSELFMGGMLLPESHYDHDDNQTATSASPSPTATTATRYLSAPFRFLLGVDAFALTPVAWHHSTASAANAGNRHPRLSHGLKPPTGSTTALFLEDWVAKMIDDELYRQGHRKEYEDEWMNKNRRAVLSRIASSGFEDVIFDDDNDNPGRDDVADTSNTSKKMTTMSNGNVGRGGSSSSSNGYHDYATYVSKEDFVQHAKDVKLAERSPERYCADRCVATGNCDVYEDMYDMTPQQVIAFCTECVLSDDVEAECDLPAAFFNDVDDEGHEEKGSSSTASKLSP